MCKATTAQLVKNEGKRSLNHAKNFRKIWIQDVSDPGANRAKRCLTCQIGRHRVFSTHTARRRKERASREAGHLASPRPRRGGVDLGRTRGMREGRGQQRRFNYPSLR